MTSKRASVSCVFCVSGEGRSRLIIKIIRIIASVIIPLLDQ